MKRLKSLVVAALLVPAFALAQPKTADEWYKEGETQYNLGDFDKAADAFKQGFAAETDESKKPAYIYNVAQAYRQGNKCKDAAFFYKRYLSLKDQDTVKPLKPEKRTEIESRITELEECAKTQPDTATTTTTVTPPVKTTPVKTTPVKTTPTKTPPRITATKADPTPAKTVAQPTEEEGEEEEEEIGTTDTFGTQPSLVSARVLLGGAYIGMGDLDVGMRGAFALFGGYPVLRQEKLLVEAGVGFAMSPIDYTNNMTTAASRASLVSALINGAATYTVMPKIKARGDLGLGVLSFSGLDMGNPFTEGNLGTTGALTMFNLRLAVSGDYEITPNLVATATPFALSYSPAKDGLRSDIGAITQLSFMVGVGYRM
jgi:tetratricopeptide (TPR) repeat protein